MLKLVLATMFSTALFADVMPGGTCIADSLRNYQILGAKGCILPDGGTFLNPNITAVSTGGLSLLPSDWQLQFQSDQYDGYFFQLADATGNGVYIYPGQSATFDVTFSERFPPHTPTEVSLVDIGFDGACLDGGCNAVSKILRVSGKGLSYTDSCSLGECNAPHNFPIELNLGAENNPVQFDLSITLAPQDGYIRAVEIGPGVHRGLAVVPEPTSIILLAALAGTFCFRLRGLRTPPL